MDTQIMDLKCYSDLSEGSVDCSSKMGEAETLGRSGAPFPALSEKAGP
jgi:hypothetical protein